MPKVEIGLHHALLDVAQQFMPPPGAPPRLAADDAANELVTDLVGHPHAYVLACLGMRQLSADVAWFMPYRLKQELGSFSFDSLANIELPELQRLFVELRLHRYPSRMAEVWHLALARIGTEYAGDASRIWAGRPSSAAIVRRWLKFKGAGPKIATMSANILVRDLHVPVSDRYSLDISVDTHVRRLFRRLCLVEQTAPDEIIIYRARELYPEYPGIFDLALWEIGRRWCRPANPDCAACPLAAFCPSVV